MAVRGVHSVEGERRGLSLTFSIHSLMTTAGDVLETRFTTSLHRNLFGAGNLLNALASVTAVLSLGEEPSLIEERLPLFEGVEGRMLSRQHDGKILIENENPVVNGWTLRTSIEEAVKGREERPLLLVVGGSPRRACANVDLALMTAELARHQNVISQVIYAGELGRALMGSTSPTGEFYSDPDEASRKALESAPEGGVVLRVVRR